MTNYQLPVHLFLVDVNYPITIFHGTSDGVIPYRNAAKLKTLLKSTDEFITINKGAHNNLNNFDLVKQKLDSLLNLR